MRVFILDDLRSCQQALSEARINLAPLPSGHTLDIARRYDQAMGIIQQEERFDIWILDHDLGEARSGYDFLKEAILLMPEKVADYVASCSSNPSGRRNINEYFKFFQKHRKDILIQDKSIH